MSYDLANKAFLEQRQMNFEQRVMKCVIICLWHCKHVPQKREVGRQQECKRYQGQILTPSQSNVSLDQATLAEDMSVLRSQFQIINSIWQISFTPSFSKAASPAICPSHALYKFPLCGKEMKKHKSIIRKKYAE